MDGITAARQLQCPIPPKISPHADAVQHWLDEWILRCGLPADSRVTRRITRGRVARYAGRLYPDATESDLRTLSALFTWFFLLDDECDSTGTPDPARVRALLSGALTLLRTGDAPGDAFSGPLRRILAEAWRAPRQRMSARWRSRFLDAVAHHFDGILTEAANKADGHHPGVAEYIELRRATSAAYVSYTLIEFATGVSVPDAIYHHPVVREISAIGNDLLSWFNDLLSLDRDAATSGGHNLVLALAREHRLSRAAAIEEAVRRWHEAMRRFTQLCAAPPRFGPEFDHGVRQLIDGVAYSVRGTMDWSLESARYQAQPGGPAAEAR
ncbi:MAG TPA: terpene synthase [Micromonospora sp.]